MPPDADTGVRVDTASDAAFEATVDALAARITQLARATAHPVVVALDGRSGSGKSTLAARLAGRLPGCGVIEGDDFYAGGTGLRSDPPAERAAACIDWRRQRAVLQALRAGRTARWQAFDWDAFDGSLCATPTVLAPAPVVLLEGTYSARPELADLLDLRVRVTTPDALRLARLQAREGGIGPWEAQWLDAEVAWFARPDLAFDVTVAT